MSKNEIIEKLAKERAVENIIQNLHSGDNEADLEDLAQDIYISLIEKPSALIEGLYGRNELLFFISKICTNNIFSANSPYYKTYKKYKKEPIEGIDIIDED